MKVISIVGYHKAGKTTLVERLVRELAKQGSVGTIKHTREEIVPMRGDTERHLAAGAGATIAMTPTRSVDIVKSMDVIKALDRLAAMGLDFAVVEGFKESDLPKVAIGDVEAKNVVARVDINAGAEDLVKIALAQPEYVTLGYLISKIKRSPRVKEAGAIGTFTGLVREMANNERTTALEFESFDLVAAERIKKIEEDLKKRQGILEVYIYHRTGRIEAGEDIVFIVILSGHREELFPALRDAIERVKAEVPIWKKEHTISGDFWVHDIH
ncbi:MAG TPA: molybdopterin synthase [Methanocella sp.]|nr:molybdopterin synthase [Methanocella sp.]